MASVAAPAAVASIVTAGVSVGGEEVASLALATAAVALLGMKH